MFLVGHRAPLMGLALAVVAVMAADARQFRSSDVQAADSPTVQAVGYMSALLRQRTDGKFGIDIEHGDKDSENLTIAQVRTGLLDMARVDLGVFNTIVPNTIVPALPYLFRSEHQLRVVLDGPIGDEILASMEPEGVVGLCFYDMGARSYYGTTGPIRRVDDMRGRKVRVQPSDIAVDMIKAMGATPVAVPFDRVSAALKAGVVDVAENNWPAYVATGHVHVAKHYSLTEHSMMPGVLVFSRKVWTELLPAERAAIRKAAKESVPFLRSQLDAYQIAARVTAETSGSQVVDDVDRRSFAQVMRPLYPALLTNPRLQALVDRVRRVDGEVARVP
jgi:tripartite ATP-independent transporter DctP family solute receptor